MENKESKLIRLTVLTLKIDKLYLRISFTANTYPLYKYIFLLSLLCSWLMNVKKNPPTQNKKTTPTQENRGLHHLQDCNIRNKLVAWLPLMLMLKKCMSSNHLNYKWNGSNWQRQTCTQADRSESEIGKSWWKGNTSLFKVHLRGVPNLHWKNFFQVWCLLFLSTWYQNLGFIALKI